MRHSDPMRFSRDIGVSEVAPVGPPPTTTTHPPHPTHTSPLRPCEIEERRGRNPKCAISACDYIYSIIDVLASRVDLDVWEFPAGKVRRAWRQTTRSLVGSL